MSCVDMKIPICTIVLFWLEVPRTEINIDTRSVVKIVRDHVLCVPIGAHSCVFFLVDVREHAFTSITLWFLSIPSKKQFRFFIYHFSIKLTTRIFSSSFLSFIFHISFLHFLQCRRMKFTRFQQSQYIFVTTNKWLVVFKVFLKFTSSSQISRVFVRNTRSIILLHFLCTTFLHIQFLFCTLQYSGPLNLNNCFFLHNI